MCSRCDSYWFPTSLLFKLGFVAEGQEKQERDLWNERKSIFVATGHKTGGWSGLGSVAHTNPALPPGKRKPTLILVL